MDFIILLNILFFLLSCFLLGIFLAMTLFWFHVQVWELVRSWGVDKRPGITAREH